jgi:hypothetical protein
MPPVLTEKASDCRVEFIRIMTATRRVCAHPERAIWKLTNCGLALPPKLFQFMKIVNH